MSLTDTESAALIDLVRAVAKREILPRFRRLAPDEISSKSGPTDLVTEADIAAEAAIADGVARLLPGANVVGEEGVAADPARLDLVGRGRTVIVDPVDGTWNYARGLAVFGVIVAVVEEGETVWGLLYDPVFDDWIVSHKDGGTWFARPGDAPRRLTFAPGGAARSASGYMSLHLFARRRRSDLALTGLKTAGTRTLRCSCHEYRMLLTGAGDYMIAAKLKPWDHAAGVLAVQEAGGRAALLDAAPYSPTRTEGPMLIARSPALWDELQPLWAPPLTA
ncbi:hypothetical protein OG2516_04888 [Oceanicola granulosus HTCC2516]|uniref:Inositol monophosphatase family protein n=1 Tax=Oceanicola granulosus (strain ATCC BAA-861 / DSM 15982 / KCTC 12143 / HTCC2516) TaxID=314256 RepID=Q2CC10_OCEGH|nr:inositol monophosphatase [Oceanicola granulosus]EAR50184.1 hypothetical protein OG2516_04888 [Oceanicola granulosus HTCC2516]